jgi:hypothetical protein
MQEVRDVRMYFFVDESGDPAILGRGGRKLMEDGLVSKTFTLGYVETENPGAISKGLVELRKEIAADEYLKGVPSLSSSVEAFHANKDCAEVKERVFRFLKSADFKAFAVVARKDEARFRQKFDLKPAKLYAYLVSKLFENRLHIYKDVDIYFAAMGNVVREHTMRGAIDEAVETFKRKWDAKAENRIRVFVQQSSQLPMLQVVDYMLWAVNRVYERDDWRYFRFIGEKFSLIQDIFDLKAYPRNFYTSAYPLEENKMSPLGG